MIRSRPQPCLHRTLINRKYSAETRRVLILPLTGDRKPFRPPTTSHMTVSEYDRRFSSNGRWLAYFSYESGRSEVYVVPFPARAKTQVSTTGGWNTIFSRNNELFFVTMGDRLMAAHMVTQPQR